MLLTNSKGFSSSEMLAAGARQAALELQVHLKVVEVAQDKVALTYRINSSQYDSLVVEVGYDGTQFLNALGRAASQHTVVAVVGGSEHRNITGIPTHYGVPAAEAGNEAAQRLNANSLLCLGTEASYLEQTVCNGAEAAQARSGRSFHRQAVDSTNHLLAGTSIQETLQAAQPPVDAILLASEGHVEAVWGLLDRYSVASVGANAQIVRLIEERRLTTFALASVFYPPLPRAPPSPR